MLPLSSGSGDRLVGLRNLHRFTLGAALTLVEAMILLAWAQFTVRFCFRHRAGWALTMRGAEDPVPPMEVHRRIRRTIRFGAKIVPWRSPCLANAMAAKRMLERRGYSSTIHLGVGTRGEGIHAHAWLDAGGAIVVGDEQRQTVTHIPR